MKRLFASGAEKRKKQKVLKINEASFPKLDAFFPSATTSRESQQHVQPDVDIELAPDHITATSLATEATEVEIARGPATQHVQDYQDATATATGSTVVVRSHLKCSIVAIDVAMQVCGLNYQRMISLIGLKRAPKNVKTPMVPFRVRVEVM